MCQQIIEINKLSIMPTFHLTPYFYLSIKPIALPKTKSNSFFCLVWPPGCIFIMSHFHSLKFLLAFGFHNITHPVLMATTLYCFLTAYAYPVVTSITYFHVTVHIHPYLSYCRGINHKI